MEHIYAFLKTQMLALYEHHHEKTGFLPMRKQRPRSASLPS